MSVIKFVFEDILIILVLVSGFFIIVWKSIFEIVRVVLVNNVIIICGKCKFLMIVIFLFLFVNIFCISLIIFIFKFFFIVDNDVIIISNVVIMRKF